tara:strand:- start:30 stop:659 length:630 start_codon:yes stop_codon:yes gene_type:complete
MAQPVIDGGTGTRSFSTDEGARLTSEKRNPPIRVRQPLMSEILTRVHKAKDKPAKVKILKEENCRALQQICQWAFNPNIASDLPSGTPPYVENDAPEGTEHMLLRTEGDKLWNFVKTIIGYDEENNPQYKSANPNLQKMDRERMFMRLLEGLHKDEAKLLCAVHNKELTYKEFKDKKGKVTSTRGIKGLSKQVLMEAFNWDDDFKVKGV